MAPKRNFDVGSVVMLGNSCGGMPRAGPEEAPAALWVRTATDDVVIGLADHDAEVVVFDAVSRLLYEIGDPHLWFHPC